MYAKNLITNPDNPIGRNHAPLVNRYWPIPLDCFKLVSPPKIEILFVAMESKPTVLILGGTLPIPTLLPPSPPPLPPTFLTTSLPPEHTIGVGFIGRTLAQYLVENTLTGHLRIADKVLPQTAWPTASQNEALQKCEFIQTNLLGAG